MKGLLRKITDYGGSFANSKSEKRNVILSNYASVIGCAAMWFLIVALVFYYGFDVGSFIRLFVASLLFFLPLVLNRLGFIVASRVLLCILIPLFVFGLSILDLKAGEPMSSSSFVGLRLFLLVSVCFPFLLFDFRQKWLLILGLSFPLVSLVFFDRIFAIFNVGYAVNPERDLYYEFSNIRSLVSGFAIGSSLYLLKLMVANAERLNENLLLRLEEQNKLIKSQAEAEVFKLNKELEFNLEKLRESEAMLRQSEYKYRSLFEQASDFIAVFDFKGRLHDVNLSWCKTFGYTKEELQTMRIEDLIEPAQLRKRPVDYEGVRQGDQLYSNRLMVRRDNTVLEVESNVKIFQDDLVLAIGRDVTQLRAVQRQIEISEAKFRGAFEHSAIGMALVSVEGKWLQVNKELSNIVGYSDEELLTMNISDIMVADPADGEFDLQRLLRHDNRESVRSEQRCLHKGGGQVWISVNASLVKDHEEKPLYFVVQIENITARKEAESKLRRYEANTLATINNTDVMIWSVDRNFETMMYNNQFARHVKEKYGEEVRVGTVVFSSLDGSEADDLRDKWRALIYRAFTGARIKVEERRFQKDYQYSLNPIMEGPEVVGVSIFAEDVTERKERDRQLSEANKKISELRLMALRSAMSPHFIFNVLNSIQYFIAKNDRLNAINYLSAFSKLVRGILTHSVTDKISLSEEIEMLTHYVQLELIRFENKFNFSLSVNPDIDMDSIVIPSLLIQPYVENAILHGLYNKQTNGNLSIRVEEENEGILMFEIEDNGIGRAAAMELRKRNILPHTSMGINITEERLKLINQGHLAAFEVEDLVEGGVPSGTRVKIRISYSDV